LRADNGANINFSCLWAYQIQACSTVSMVALKKVAPFTAAQCISLRLVFQAS